MRPLTMLICISLFIAVVFGCASQKIDAKPAPEMLSKTTVDGKGFPNGRSDTNDGFIQLGHAATDPSYGYTEDNPVKVGGVRQGPSREKAYLNALRDSAGQPVEYERLGSCCPFKTPSGFLGTGFLDVFRVIYEGQSAPARIYINSYEEGPLLVPVGFTARQAGQ